MIDTATQLDTITRAAFLGLLAPKPLGFNPLPWRLTPHRIRHVTRYTHNYAWLLKGSK